MKIMPLAHVKWFVQEPAPLEWSRLLALPTLAGLALAVVGGAAARWVVGRVDQERLTRWLRQALRPYLPLVLSLHLALSLAAYAATDRYLAPSLRLPGGTWGTVLGALELVVAALIAAGLLTRLAAGLLVLSGPVGMAFYGVVPILERVELLGIALYLAVAGRRKWSLDALREKRDPGLALNPLAVATLRVGAGLAIAVTALTEKLLAPETSIAFLREHSSLNFLGVSDHAFVDLVGAAELAMGLVLLSGVATRLVVLAAVVPFNLTLLLFGTTELVGHLPIYGIFLVLLVEGSGSVRSPVSSGTGGSSRSPAPTA